MASGITNPDLISVLIDNPNSIFIIEDAENILIDREKEGLLRFNSIINSPMTLAAIYNQDEKEFLQIKRSCPIGFSAYLLS